MRLHFWHTWRWQQTPTKAPPTNQMGNQHVYAAKKLENHYAIRKILTLKLLWTSVSSRSITMHFLCISWCRTGGNRYLGDPYTRGESGPHTPSPTFSFLFFFLPKQHRSDRRKLFLIFLLFSDWAPFSSDTSFSTLCRAPPACAKQINAQKILIKI